MQDNTCYIWPGISEFIKRPLGEKPSRRGTVTAGPRAALPGIPVRALLPRDGVCTLPGHSAPRGWLTGQTSILLRNSLPSCSHGNSQFFVSGSRGGHLRRFLQDQLLISSDFCSNVLHAFYTVSDISSLKYLSILQVTQVRYCHREMGARPREWHPVQTTSLAEQRRAQLVSATRRWNTSGQRSGLWVHSGVQSRQHRTELIL